MISGTIAAGLSKNLDLLNSLGGEFALASEADATLFCFGNAIHLTLTPNVIFEFRRHFRIQKLMSVSMPITSFPVRGRVVETSGQCAACHAATYFATYVWASRGNRFDFIGTAGGIRTTDLLIHSNRPASFSTSRFIKPSRVKAARFLLFCLEKRNLRKR
jgi:hypothetical protein